MENWSRRKRSAFWQMVYNEEKDRQAMEFWEKIKKSHGERVASSLDPFRGHDPKKGAAINRRGVATVGFENGELLILIAQDTRVDYIDMIRYLMKILYWTLILLEIQFRHI